MRWYSLTEEESRVCGAPRRVDSIGALSLSRWGQWRADALFVILSAFFDESGMGEEPRLTIGGFVFNLAQLQIFNQRWSAHLKRNHIPYAHYTEMLDHAPPHFTDWDSHRVWEFYVKGLEIAKKRAVMGVTVTIDKDEFHRHYKNKFGTKNEGDSIFGLCARVTMQYLVGYFDKYAGIPAPHLNMIFDKQDQYGGAAKAIFYEMKSLYGDGNRVLGDFGFGENSEACGLQIADFLAAFARQIEPDALRLGVRKEVDGLPKPIKDRPHTPIMHVPVGEDAFDLFFGEQTETLPKLRARRKWLKRQLAKAQKSERA